LSVDFVISVRVAVMVRVTMATVMIVTVMMMVMVVTIWSVRMIEMMMVVVIREPVFAEITTHQENRAQTGDQHT